MLSYLFVGLFILFLYKLDFHFTLKDRYNKIKSLNQLVSSQYKNVFVIFWVSFYIIMQAMYIKFLQLVNKSMVKINKNTYQLTYVINGQLYKLIVKTRKGPKNVILATDENDEDITDIIHSYMGPCENFHGDTITPEFFGKNKITLNLSSGEDKTFDKTDAISI